MSTRVCLFALATLAPFAVAANERHLTYTYESAVLPQGARELEVWSTARLGREQRYARFDERVEFEVGLTDRLQTSFYLNFNAISQRVNESLLTESQFTGVSS